MGRDKTRLQLEGETLVARAARRLEAICPSVVIADRGRGSASAWPSIADGPGAGPAAGILGAAAACPGRDLMVLACDLPRVPAALLGTLAGIAAGDWVVPRWTRGLEPLCALYRPPVLAALAARVARGQHALHPLANTPGLTVLYLEGQALQRAGDPAWFFCNVNTPRDAAALGLRGSD